MLKRQSRQIQIRIAIVMYLRCFPSAAVAVRAFGEFYATDLGPQLRGEIFLVRVKANRGENLTADAAFISNMLFSLQYRLDHMHHEYHAVVVAVPAVLVPGGEEHVEDAA